MYLCSSPVRQKTGSPPKPVRPPPPKYVPRRTVPHAVSIDSVDISSQKPKPPVRTRKKKFFTTDDVKHPRQSEFVELSTSDIIVDVSSPGGEVRVVSDGAESKEQDGNMLAEVQEEVEEGEDLGSEGVAGEIDLDKDEWEVIPDSAAGDDSQKVIFEERCIHPNG